MYYYYQNDHLGTPGILHDKQGQVVNTREMKAFGSWIESVNTIDDKFGFSGQYRDSESSLNYNLFRYYDENTGRYTQEDPILLKSSNNVYNYTENSPIMFSDFNGLKRVTFGTDEQHHLGCGCYTNCMSCNTSAPFLVGAICTIGLSFIPGVGLIAAFAGGAFCGGLDNLYNQIECQTICDDFCRGFDVPCPAEGKNFCHTF
jgi:RHS repeat-associated protein